MIFGFYEIAFLVEPDKQDLDQKNSDKRCAIVSTAGGFGVHAVGRPSPDFCRIGCRASFWMQGRAKSELRNIATLYHPFFL